MTETTPINSVGVELNPHALEAALVAHLDGVGCTPWKNDAWDRCDANGTPKRVAIQESVERAISAYLSAAPTPPVGQENSSSQGLSNGLRVDASCAPSVYALQAIFRPVVDWFADEIAAAERGKPRSRAGRKRQAKAEALNRIIAAMPADGDLSPHEQAGTATDCELKPSPNATPGSEET